MIRDELYDKLKEKGIFGRRYFYPLISEFSTYRGLESAKPENLVNAHKMAEEVICLHIYDGLRELKIDSIVKIITK